MAACCVLIWSKQVTRMKLGTSFQQSHTIQHSPPACSSLFSLERTSQGAHCLAVQLGSVPAQLPRQSTRVLFFYCARCCDLCPASQMHTEHSCRGESLKCSLCPWRDTAPLAWVSGHSAIWLQAGRAQFCLGITD